MRQVDGLPLLPSPRHEHDVIGRDALPEILRSSDLEKKGRSSRNGEKGYAGAGE